MGVTHMALFVAGAGLFSRDGGRLAALKSACHEKKKRNQWKNLTENKYGKK
jgi:hypothetical protein